MRGVVAYAPPWGRGGWENAARSIRAVLSKRVFGRSQSFIAREKCVTVIILFLVLFVSLAFHVSYLIRYIQTRIQKYLQRYILTTVSNVFISAALIYFTLYYPEQIQKIKFPLLLWLLSGTVMVVMLMLQFTIFRRTYNRSKMPEHYHYNFFGKKVLHGSVLKPIEVGLFFASIPLFLIAGAYFVAKMIRLFF